MRGAARHRADIQAVLQGAQFRCVYIDDGNIVLFVGEVFCQGAADLTGTENDDFHGLLRLAK